MTFRHTLNALSHYQRLFFYNNLQAILFSLVTQHVGLDGEYDVNQGQGHAITTDAAPDDTEVAVETQPGSKRKRSGSVGGDPPILKATPISLVPCDQRTLNRVAATMDVRGMIAAGNDNDHS